MEDQHTPINREERLWEIVQDQSRTIQSLMGMIKEKNSMIKRLREELEAKTNNQQ